ncbi:MAG: sigma-70 family RNA polymerase sigma factor, partial [Oscillospiraceae bacterium]|nr:sigma-70 family RNA polymerase sigma factor [Oscillospiraceae bacterium]
MEDSKIVDLYWQRSEEAIPETAAKFGGYCRTIAYNILSDEQDAEECVNDTWFKAWNSMPANRPALLAPYLAKLTRWLALTSLRKRNALRRGGGETPMVLDELAEVIPDNADLEKQVEMKELSEA